MAIIINETSVAAETTDPGIKRQRLLTNERVKGTRLLLDRITMATGAQIHFELPAKSFAWLQLIDGDATFKAYYTERMSDSYSVLLPPGFPATLTTSNGAVIIYTEIADIGRIDPKFSDRPPLFQVMDWMREPVFESEHDARKRISLVNPAICGTPAIKIDMVLYPAGSMAQNYQHVGAETIIYVVSGRGTAWANEQPLPVQDGDTIYFPDGEWHHLKAVRDMRFLEFYVPGEFKTVWATPAKASAWLSTNRDINGHETAHDYRERMVFAKIFGNPWVR